MSGLDNFTGLGKTTGLEGSGGLSTHFGWSSGSSLWEFEFSVSSDWLTFLSADLQSDSWLDESFFSSVN